MLQDSLFGRLHPSFTRLSLPLMTSPYIDFEGLKLLKFAGSVTALALATYHLHINTIIKRMKTRAFSVPSDRHSDVNILPKCWSILLFQDESTHYEMMVYVQYDRHVQQAIDEQVLVRCDPDERVVVKASLSQPRDDPEVKITERPRRPLVKAARSVSGTGGQCAVFSDVCWRCRLLSA